jgi:hypothetical protein
MQRVVNIFIASPRDVNEERCILGKTIEEINKIIRDFDIRIELYGGDDTLPGVGRPQELINKDVDNCELFIGILSMRWGTHTRKFSSGFEEEFCRAKERHSETGLPQIWLFFKKIDPQLLDDPGEQLRNVIKFREEQERLKELYFKEFSEINEWRQMIHESLFRHILNISLNSNKPAEGETQNVATPANQVSENSPVTISDNGEDKETIPRQIFNLLEVSTKAINTGTLIFSSSADKSEDRFNIIRLYLLTISLLSKRYTNEYIGVHEINLLFVYREKLELTRVERNIIFRTLIGASNDVTPGWYWFKDMNYESLRNLLFYHAISDNNEIVRIGAIELLTSAAMQPDANWSKDFNVIQLLLNDKSDNIKSRALSYLATVGVAEDLPLIESILSDNNSSIRRQALFAKLSIVNRQDSNEAFSQFLSIQADLDKVEIIKLFEVAPIRLQSSLLLTALCDNNKSTKIFSIRELARRNELTKDILLSLLEHANKEFKEILYKIILEGDYEIDLSRIKNDPDISFDNKRDLLYSLYSSFDTQDLEKKLDWYDSDGPTAYELLGLRNFELLKNNIIADLNDNFENFHKKSQDKLENVFGVNSKSILESYDQKLDNFIRSNYLASALRILEKHGHPESIRIARTYLNASNYEDLKIAAIKIIEKMGDLSDIENVMSMYNTSYGETKILAADTVLKLCINTQEGVGFLFKTGDTFLIKLALESALEKPIEDTIDIIESLLQNDKDAIRYSAVYYLANKLSNDDFEKKLINHINSSNYHYYNIICWFDRILYAPEPLNKLFRIKLETTFKRINQYF